MPFLKRSGRVKAFLENTTRRVEIFQKSRLGLDASLEDRFHIFASINSMFSPTSYRVFAIINKCCIFGEFKRRTLKINNCVNAVILDPLISTIAFPIRVQWTLPLRLA